MRVHLPDKGVTMYVVINPRTRLVPPSCTKVNGNGKGNGNGISIALPRQFSRSEEGELIDQPLDPKKPNLVFTHAALLDSESFEAQFCDERLTNGMNLIGVDLRFHGRTTGEKTIEKFSVEAHSALFMETLDKIGLTEYMILGICGFGCNVATWLALKRPEKVKGAILVTPGEFKSVATLEMRRDWLIGAVVNKDGKGDETGDLPKEKLTWMSDWYFVSGQQVQERARFERAFQNRYGTNQTDHDLSHVFLDLTRDPEDEVLSAEDRAAIKCPVLILQGGEDVILSPTSACMSWVDALTSAQDGADLRVIKGAPPLLLCTDYNVANRFILSFVSRYHVASTKVSSQ